MYDVYTQLNCILFSILCLELKSIVVNIKNENVLTLRSSGINSLKLKTSKWWIVFIQTHRFLLHKMLIDRLDLCGLLVNYCDVFISCLDSHSDGTHSLQRIHWWASDVILQVDFSKSVLVEKQTLSWMAWGWVHIQQIFIIGWTTALTAAATVSCPKRGV